jgi:hypothetical protein
VYAKYTARLLESTHRTSGVIAAAVVVAGLDVGAVGAAVAGVVVGVVVAAGLVVALGVVVATGAVVVAELFDLGASLLQPATNNPQATVETHNQRMSHVSTSPRIAMTMTGPIGGS